MRSRGVGAGVVYPVKEQMPKDSASNTAIAFVLEDRIEVFIL